MALGRNASVSPSLVELVEQQIGAVSDDVRDVVDLVAIAEPIEREQLLSLADPAAIEAAEQRELITAASAAGTVCVGHPLYSEIRLGRCGPTRLRRLRGQVATAMAQAAVPTHRLALLRLESDLSPDAELLFRGARVAASRLDVRLAERLCRATIAAQPSPVAKLLLTQISSFRKTERPPEKSSTISVRRSRRCPTSRRGHPARGSADVATSQSLPSSDSHRRSDNARR